MVDRPFASSRPIGPIFSSESGAPKPDKPKRGRRSPRTEEEILQFMDRCMASDWATRGARSTVEGLTGMSYESIPQENLNAIKLNMCAGVISREHVSGRSSGEIIELYVENRDIEVPEDEI